MIEELLLVLTLNVGCKVQRQPDLGADIYLSTQAMPILDHGFHFRTTGGYLNL